MDQLRRSVGQVFELDCWVSQNAISRCYPPLSEMVLKVSLSPTPASPIPISNVSWHFGRHGCEVVAIEAMNVATVDPAHDIECAIYAFKDGADVLRSQSILMSEADEAAALGLLTANPKIAGVVFQVESEALWIEHAELNLAFCVGDNFLCSSNVNPQAPVGSSEHLAHFGGLPVPTRVDAIDDPFAGLWIANHERQSMVGA